MTKNIPLYEKYRPKSFDEVVGQQKVIEKINTVRKTQGLGGHAFWISGDSGTGKTTIARILAHEIADDEWFHDERSAVDITLPILRDLSRTQNMLGGGQRKGRAFIVNEAHYLRDTVVIRFLKTCEPPPKHVIWVFTTTVTKKQELFPTQKKLADTLLGRCETLELALRGFGDEYAKHVQHIAKLENLDGKPFSEYLDLFYRHQKNMRAMLNAVEAGEMLADR
jgi:DNA polymerase III subunit gamma/tau